jgi:hypothetical protein
MAVDRHEFIKQTTYKEKGKAYNTARFPVLETSFEDRYIFSRDGDRLDNLAFQFYGDPRHWVILALANNLGKGTLEVPPNLQLRIPPKSIITDFRERLESTEEER